MLYPTYSQQYLSTSRAPTWPFVRRRFERLLANLQLTPDQLDGSETSHRNVVACLNRAYWGISHEVAHSELIGSRGKGTRVRPPRDVDVLFQLPSSVYERFEERQGNKQSQLLQEVRDVLIGTFPATRMRADGQVVVIPFNSCPIEVAPGFVLEGGGYWICDTNDGGRYKWVYPGAELADLDYWDRQLNGNVRKLAQIFKQWQRFCNVPIESFQLEALIKEALRALRYGAGDEYWYDWLVRDVLEHMQYRADGSFPMPGTGEIIFLGNAWLSRVQTAYARAVRACDHEHDDNDEGAGEEWQKIFGPNVPLTVT